RARQGYGPEKARSKLLATSAIFQHASSSPRRQGQSIRLCTGVEAIRMEYRRGLIDDSIDPDWHFIEECPRYPTTNMAISKSKPRDGRMCPRCLRLSLRRSIESRPGTTSSMQT